MSTAKLLPAPELRKIDGLRLDPLNPRLPEDQRGQSQSELLTFVARNYDILSLATSIATYGYFTSEPLIAVSHGAELIVVEGNRRLATLQLLRHPETARSLGTREGKAIAELGENSANIPDEVPVIVVKKRDEVAPVIGYRHISGIQPWDPWQKSRFIAQLIDDGHTFANAALLVGEEESDVRSHYRNYKIFRQVHDRFKLPTDGLVNSFGVFTRAMNSEGLRAMIDAPAPSEVKKGQDPLPMTAKAPFREFSSYVFGSEHEEPVIRESRDLTRLGKVVNSTAARRVLRATRSLSDAEDETEKPRTRLLRRLGIAAGALENALPDIKRFAGNDEVTDLLSRCGAALKALQKSA